MRLHTAPGQKNVSPRLMLNYISTAMKLREALPQSWEDLKLEHFNALEDMLPMVGSDWQSVCCFAVSIPIRTVIFTGHEKNAFMDSWKFWEDSPVLVLDDSGTGGALGLCMVMPWRFLEPMLEITEPPFVANPVLGGGMFCFRVRDAVECRKPH